MANPTWNSSAYTANTVGLANSRDPQALVHSINNVFIGPIVRIGPNRYSLSQPKDVKKIYEIGGKYIKSDFYNPFHSPIADEQNIFAMKDNILHKERRRKISPMYTMSSMVSYEPAVDEMTHICIDKLYQFAKEKRLVDVPHFVQHYAFDVIGAITVSFFMTPTSRLKS